MRLKGLTALRESRIHTILRVLLGAIFIYASLPKIIDPQAFADIVSGYRILPGGLVHPVAIILPWIEVICGLLLILGHLTRGCALLVDTLMLVFILAFVISIYRGIDISCGCFSLSPTAKHSLYLYLVRDLFIFLIGVWVLMYEIKRDQFVV